MEVDPGVGAGLGLDLGLELEVLEAGLVHRPDVEQVAPLAVCDQHPVADRPGPLVLAGLPPVERLAVKKALPPGGLVTEALHAHWQPARKTQAHTTTAIRFLLMVLSPDLSCCPCPTPFTR